MYKFLMGLIISTACHGLALSQSVSPVAVNSAGRVFIQDNASVGFTIGETVIQYFVDSVGNMLCGGVIPSSQCAIEVTAIPDNNRPFNVLVHPIPSTTYFTIDAQNIGVNLFTIEVFDLSGALVYQETHSSTANRIRIAADLWAPGVYLLRISDMTRKRFSQFKLVKQ